ncbi:MAG: hypothetical protein OXG15_07360 [Gammaproteobacteria bacterium]|nr:hypothetical protein [Gammaproteobacteria bacterium]
MSKVMDKVKGWFSVVKDADRAKGSAGAKLDRATDSQIGLLRQALRIVVGVEAVPTTQSARSAILDTLIWFVSPIRESLALPSDHEFNERNQAIHRRSQLIREALQISDDFASDYLAVGFCEGCTKATQARTKQRDSKRKERDTARHTAVAGRVAQACVTVAPHMMTVDWSTFVGQAVVWGEDNLPQLVDSSNIPSGIDPVDFVVAGVQLHRFGVINDAIVAQAGVWDYIAADRKAAKGNSPEATGEES